MNIKNNTADKVLHDLIGSALIYMATLLDLVNRDSSRELDEVDLAIYNGNVYFLITVYDFFRDHEQYLLDDQAKAVYNLVMEKIQPIYEQSTMNMKEFVLKNPQFVQRIKNETNNIINDEDIKQFLRHK